MYIVFADRLCMSLLLWHGGLYLQTIRCSCCLGAATCRCTQQFQVVVMSATIHAAPFVNFFGSKDWQQEYPRVPFVAVNMVAIPCNPLSIASYCASMS